MSPPYPRILCIIETVGMGGGAEQLLATLLPEMRRQGADVEVVALFDWPDDLGAEMEREGLVVHRLRIRSPLALLEGCRKIRPLVRERQYDVFWGHLYYGNFYARMAQVLSGGGLLAITFHSEGYGQLSRGALRARLRGEAERLILRTAEVKVAVSAAVRDDYRSYFGWRRISIIPNGVDCPRLHAAISPEPGGVRREFGYSDDDFLIVTPARYIVKKGHRHLIEALERLRDTKGFRPKLLCCGDGPFFDRIAAEVAARGLNGQVTVSPVIPHERLLPLIAAADAVVLPSLREPFGIAAAEAMALGTPCVLSDVDGFRELTANAECALLVPPGDAEALAAAIHRLHGDPHLRTDLGKRGHDHVCAAFGIRACAQRWIGILEGAATSRPNASARPRIFW